MSEHARLAPSAAHRWTQCPGSVLRIERAVADGRIPADTSNDAADEGTAAHVIRAECAILGLEPADYIGTSVRVNGKDWPVTEEMAEALQGVLDWIAEQDFITEPLVEHRVSLGPGFPGQFGTVDWAAVRVEKSADDGFERPVLTLTDLKYGYVPVSPKRNPQQILYALPLVDHFAEEGYHVEDVEFLIDQPRKGGLKVWRCSVEELRDIGAEFAKVGRLALSEGAPIVPSAAACAYCPLRAPGMCAERDEWILGMCDLEDLPPLPDLAEPPQMPAAAWLTPERRAYLALHASTVKRWFDDLAKASHGAAMHGHPDPGTKLVLGRRGDRKWGDEQQAEALLTTALGEKAYLPKTVIGVPAAERLLKPTRTRPGDPETWAALCELVDRAEPGIALVPASDDAPEYHPPSALDAQLDDL